MIYYPILCHYNYIAIFHTVQYITHIVSTLHNRKILKYVNTRCEKLTASLQLTTPFTPAVPSSLDL